MTDSTLNLRKIFWFWLPLAASWALMTLEGPTIQATISRLPEATTMLAAAGIVLSMEVTFESPIMMLLATGTALGGLVSGRGTNLQALIAAVAPEAGIAKKF